jgi:hypothetical protein
MPKESRSRADAAEYLEKEIQKTLAVARKAGLSRTLILILEQARDEARANKGPRSN